MSIWAIVPVKPLRLGKSRLAGVLKDDERAALNRRFLQQTIETLKSTREISQILVISRDPGALAVARQYNVRTIHEDGTPNLNSALARATMLARQYASRGVLVLPADLPLITQEDLSHFLEFVGKPPCVVISPDRHDNGTNALLVSPGGLIACDFGPGSFERHCSAAMRVGANLQVVRRERIMLDLDTPDDLEMLRRIDGTKA